MTNCLSRHSLHDFSLPVFLLQQCVVALAPFEQVRSAVHEAHRFELKRLESAKTSPVVQKRFCRNENTNRTHKHEHAHTTMADYKYMPLSIQSETTTPFVHYIYFKMHKEKNDTAPNTTLFVCNLPLVCNQLQLLKVFQIYGPVKDVKFQDTQVNENPNDNSKESNGYIRTALVRFKDESACKKALISEQLDTPRKINVQEEKIGVKSKPASHHSHTQQICT